MRMALPRAIAACHEFWSILRGQILTTHNFRTVSKSSPATSGTRHKDIAHEIWPVLPDSGAQTLERGQ
jgi:hypothetical protein